MARAHIFFCKPLTYDTATALIHACRALTGEKDQQGNVLWDELSISIASGGGDVIGGFAAFNELKGLQARVRTHNAGAVDSAAISPFIAGARRTACAASAFFFHRLHWTFPSNNQLTMSTITDATQWLTKYESMLAEVVAARSKLKKDDILKLMREGTSIDPAEAKKMGLIHDIEELATPLGARTWQA